MQVLPTLIFYHFFDNEIKNLQSIYAEKLRSAGILDFYTLNDIKKICNFSLCPKSLSFISGFKKVFQEEKKYQFDSVNILELQVYYSE